MNDKWRKDWKDLKNETIFAMFPERKTGSVVYTVTGGACLAENDMLLGAMAISCIDKRIVRRYPNSIMLLCCVNEIRNQSLARGGL